MVLNEYYISMFKIINLTKLNRLAFHGPKKVLQC
jgi:hypothetical protein